MQLTIEIPDDLAERLGTDRNNLREIIERGLRRRWSKGSPLAREVISFLAQGPPPQAILEFRPSEKSIRRSRELLQKNREGRLTQEDEVELDEMADLDHLMTLIKAEAAQHLRSAE